jgi:transposase
MIVTHESETHSGRIGESMNELKLKATGPRGPVEIPTQSTEAPAVGRKRRHTIAERLRILEESDLCKHGELGALLRREGLYHSTIRKWRKWRDEMADKGLVPDNGKRAVYNELARVKRENKRLKLQLERTKGLIDLQKKALELLESMDLDEKSSEDS